MHAWFDQPNISVKLGSLEKGEKVQQTRQLLGYEPTAFKLCVFIKKATLTRKSMSSIMTIPIQILQLHYIHFSFLLSLDRHKKIKKRPPGLARLKKAEHFLSIVGATLAHAQEVIWTSSSPEIGQKLPSHRSIKSSTNLFPRNRWLKIVPAQSNCFIPQPTMSVWYKWYLHQCDQILE